MTLIWYNPDLDIYESGLQSDLNLWKKSSQNHYRFEIIHEFADKDPALKIADKILKSLNVARLLASRTREIFA